MDYSNPGLMGAVIGGAIGLLDYVIIMAFMSRVLNRDVNDPDAGQPTEEGRAKVRQSLRYIKPAVMFGSFVIFPVAGYFAGRQFSS